MKKSLRRALWAGAVVAVAAAAVPVIQASAAAACAPAWNASSVYTKDNQVSYQSKNYTAKWWTQNEVPTASGEWGVWKDGGACGGTSNPTPTPTSPTASPTTSPTASPTASPTKPPTTTNPPQVGNKWIVGYFAQWGVYARNYHVKNIDTSGSASKITHILYAFANTTGGRCSNKDAAPNGDVYADREKAYTAADSVDGVADTWDQPLRGNFNQLLKLKKKHPHLKVIYSVGGWTWSKGFPAAAANLPAFVQSCKAMIDEANGLAQAAHKMNLFDGIDIDWEFPMGCGDANHCDTTSGFSGYANMMKALRGVFPKPFLLTSAITADASPNGKMNAADYAGGAQHMDKIFPMTYDFFGAFNAQGPTAPHSPLSSYNGIPQQGFNTEAAIKNLRDKGVPASKILLGIGFYGRGWSGVTQAAPGGSATGAAPGTYEPGIEDYKVLKNTCPATGTIGGTAYAKCGNNWYGYDTPATIAGKLGWAKQQGLGGAFFWEFSGDTPNGELITAIKSNL